MRPLELRLRNFRSYYGPETVFDFRSRRLVGIVGPIGSGKSSILDAVAFALYGRTPTIAAATRGLIHQRARDATVALRFEVDGEVWEAVRMLRRKGQSQHALYRYESDQRAIEPVDRITMEGEVNAKVVELLGLDFDTFGRSVLLAQGRFAEFLRARPADRDKVLKGVFGHDRLDVMRTIARGHSAEQAVELEKLVVRVEQVDRVRERLEERRSELLGATDRLEQLRKAEPELVDLERRLEVAAARRAAVQERLDDLADHRERLPDPDASRRLLDDAHVATERRRGLADELVAAQAAAVDADAALAAAEGLRTQIEEGTGRLAAAEAMRRAAAEAQSRASESALRLDKHAEQVTQARRRMESCRAAEAAARAALATHRKAVIAAEEQLHEARHADIAATLRAELHSGDRCPVCEQTVEIVPEGAAEFDLRHLEDEVETARVDLSSAEEALLAAVAEAQGAQESLAALEEAAAALDAQAAGDEESLDAKRADERQALDELAALVGKGDPEARLGEIRSELELKAATAADRRKDVDRVRTDHDAAIRAEQDADKLLSALRVDVVDLAARLGLTLEVGDDAASIGSALGELHEVWAAATESHQRELEQTAADAEAARSGRLAILEELDVTDSFEHHLASTAARVELLQSEIQRDQAEVAAAADLMAERDRLAADKARYDRVAADLTDAKFVRFLLDEERTLLAELGSEHFQRLSSGRYRFSEDGAFNIVDLAAADAERKADSLSGGETFLASLALALALAEMVTRTGGRLDAFFLDEGFGTLDPEHLDLAMEGIEALVTGGSERVVVVVSHVPELRRRIEDLIELDRDPVTGDSRVIAG